MRPNKKEKNLHPNIPITYVILDYRRWKVGLKEEDKFNQTTIEIKGSPPWTYKFQNLNPWTFIDVRVRFGNRNGTGRPSDWKHGHSKEGSKLLYFLLKYLKGISNLEICAKCVLEIYFYLIKNMGIWKSQYVSKSLVDLILKRYDNKLNKNKEKSITSM